MEWLPPSLTASQCAKVVVFNATRRGGRRDEEYDDWGRSRKDGFSGSWRSSNRGGSVPQEACAKAVFRIYGRARRLIVIYEAYGSAHYWAREMKALGHEVKLISPQYVRPFVKRQKNDAADAEAIVIAARQPEMRFVEPKTVDQQSCAAVFRGRERLVHQRTADVNALRALLYEHGRVFSNGIQYLNRMAALVEDEAADLSVLIREECLDLLAQIAEKTARIIAYHPEYHETQDAGCRVRQGAPASDHARCWAANGYCGGSVWPRHNTVQNWARLCGLIGSCSHATFFWRQGTFGADDQDRPSRYPTPPDHWRNVAIRLAWAAYHYGGELAVTDVGAQTQDAGCDRTGQ